MKRLFFLALLAACCWAPALADTFNVACSTGAADCELVAAGSSAITVRQIMTSQNAADTLTLKCATTAKIGPLYFDSKSGVHVIIQSDRRTASPLTCAAGQALNITKGSASTPLTVWGEYNP